MSTWQTHSSRTTYENAWIRVREDSVTRPDGSAGIYGVMEVRRPAVFVVALTDDDEVVMVELFRYATGAMSLEVPAGGTDGEDPLVAARRELLEETGLEADSWTPIGSMFALNGVCHAPEHVYLARGVRRPADRGTSASDSAPNLPRSAPTAAVAADDGVARPGNHADHGEGSLEEGITAVRRIPWPTVLDLVRDGTITDGETVAALMYAALALGRVY